MSHKISEFVGKGHPDNMADVIVDTILEKILEYDIDAKFSCEALVSKGLVVIAGEITVSTSPDYKSIISSVLSELGYYAENFEIITNIKEQSRNIQETSLSQSGHMKSGDQSIVFGYATNETSTYMPISYILSRDIMKMICESVENGRIRGVKFDAKCIVILEELKRVNKVFISIHHEEGLDKDRLLDDLFIYVIQPVMDDHGVSVFRDEVFVNESGPFYIGGLDADTGMVNRKLIMDSYGPSVRHGGGGYSGKDLSKVDRLGAYYSR